MADGKIRINTELETKSFDAQINKLENDLETMVKTLETEAQIDVKFRMSKEERLALERDIEQVRNKIISLQQQKQKLENDSFDFSQMKDGFEKIIKFTKKLTLGILSIQTAYSIISKASSSYLSTDEKSTKQLEANWIGLGTIFGNLVTLVVSGLKKVVTGVLYFMQLLTGTNYIAKANEAILKKQKKATDNLTKSNNKLTASFDEMNILQDNSENVAGSETTDFTEDMLFDIKDLGDNTINIIEKVAKAIKPIYEIIKEIVNFCLDNPNVILGLIGGTALLKMLTNVMGVAGAGTAVGTGLAGLLGVLLAIASIGVITISIITIKKTIEETIKANEEVIESANDVKETSNKVSEAVQDYAKQLDRTKPSSKNFVETQLQIAETALTHADNVYEVIDGWNGFERMINTLDRSLDAHGEALSTNTTLVYNQIKSLSKLCEEGKLTSEETEEFKEIMERFMGIVDKTSGSVTDLQYEFGLNYDQAVLLKDQYNDVKNSLSNLNSETNDSSDYLKILAEKLGITSDKSKNAYDKIYTLKDVMEKLHQNKDIKLGVDADTSKAQTKLQSFFQGLSNSKLFSGSIFGSIFSGLASLGNIRFAKGGIVNNPGRGVPINAIAGESGKEGIIPLTDSQQMALLGEAIGKYININLTNITKLDNRQIAREQKVINNRNDFVSNK